MELSVEFSAKLRVLYPLEAHKTEFTGPLLRKLTKLKNKLGLTHSQSM